MKVLKPKKERSISHRLPFPGDIYSFRTSPLSEFAAPETGRFGVFKIIGANELCLAIAVLEGIWDHPPQLDEASRASLLREHRFAHTGRVAAFGVQTAWWRPSDLKSVTLLGEVPPSPEERRIGGDIIAFAVGTSHSALNAVNHAAEGEWRWMNDREALVAEFEKQKAKVTVNLGKEDGKLKIQQVTIEPK